MAKKNQTLELGDLARDMVTGYEGVVVACAKFLTGCDRVTLQAKVDSKDSKLPEPYGFDVTTVEVIKKHAVTPIGRELPETPALERKPGGPPTREQRY